MNLVKGRILLSYTLQKRLKLNHFDTKTTPCNADNTEKFLYIRQHGLSKKHTTGEFYVSRLNQTRICGKGVGLGLFPSDSLQSEPYEIDEITHKGP